MDPTRRAFLSMTAAAPLAVSAPPGVTAILYSTLKRDPGSFNTDWFGTCLMKGLLDWGRRIPEARAFAKRWLEHHLGSRQLSPYSGNRSRPVSAGGIPLTTYAGHFGLAIPCYQLYQEFQDPRARQVVVDIAEIILHRIARNRLGLAAHDDTARFAIPDTCYFAATALMMGAELSGRVAYRDDALYQIRTYVDTFLDREKGLAKTILLEDGIGKTYWTRATGWLLWSVNSVLRYLPAGAPEYERLTADLRTLAGGIARAQDSSGGLRLYLDDRSSPLETTGTAMCAMGLHEAIRMRWLPGSFAPVAARAWEYCTGKVTAEGEIRGAYTGWAVPAERGEIQMDQVKMGWIPGFILSAAAEMTGAVS